MVDYQRDRLLSKLEDLRSKIENREAELKQQNSESSNPSKDSELQRLENEYHLWEKALRRHDAAPQKLQSKELLRKPDTSDIKQSVRAAVKIHSKVESHLSSSAQPQYQEGWQLQLDQMGDKLYQKVVSKILNSMGVNVVKEFQRTSTEGKIVGAALGGAVAAASLADGQIDSLDVLGIAAAAWIGTKMGEAITPAEKFYKKGIENESQGNYTEAIISFNKAISKDKNYCGAYFRRGCIYAEVGEIEKANQDLSKVVLLSPNCIDGYKKRASTRYAIGDYSGAVEDSSFAIRDQPDWEDYRIRGMAHAALKQSEDALQDFSAALELNTQNASIYLLRGILYSSDCGNPRQAIQDFDRAIRLESRNAEAFLYKAIASFNLGRHQAAIQSYSQAIHLGSADVKTTAYSGRCLAFLALNKRWEARRDALVSGFNVRGLGLTKTELLGFTVPCLLVSVLFANNLFQGGREATESVQPQTPTVAIESQASIASPATVAPQEECNKLSQALSSSSALRAAFAANSSVSGVDNLIASTEEIVQVNSAFSQQLSNLSLQSERLANIQNSLLKLSREIYLTQYNKLRALKQLKASNDSTTTNLLMQEYIKLDSSNQNFNSDYKNILDEFQNLCSK